MIETDVNAIVASGSWYWKNNNIGAIADDASLEVDLKVRRVTAKINTGLDQLAKRKAVGKEIIQLINNDFWGGCGMSCFRRMAIFKYFGLLAVFVAFSTFACEAPKDTLYQPLRVGGGYIVVKSTPVIEDEGKANPEMGLGITFLDCNAGEERFIARLPYIADPGEVVDAFLAKTGNGSKDVFIIHSSPIRAFTGVSYGSDYFSVMVFRKALSGYELDKKNTDYFGSGADVVLRDGDTDEPVYTYPYKNRNAVMAQLASENYSRWLKGENLELEVTKKTSIYSSAAIANKTKMYLAKGDKVNQEAVSAGWISIVYKSTKGKEIRGWVLCESVSGC
ncbi:hypothetical protein V2J93_26700 [Pseudomonas alliivorans]|nr:hypothetical protein [Pseudomonas alliivorans]